MFTTLTLPSVIKTTSIFNSFHLNREVELEFYKPDNLLGNERLNLLLLNDGQDLEPMDMESILNKLHEKWEIEPIVVVGIKASKERVLEYGVAGQLDFMKRGAKAKAYTDFIINELLPFLHDESDLNITGKRAFAGFSLGGVSAFDISWNFDQHFDIVGVFSGSFWWRKKALNDGFTDDDRIVHKMISETRNKPKLKFWFMAGTKDELADRNGNFIIDSIDDTVDVVKVLMEKGYQRPNDMFYYELVGGRHDVMTWASAMPKFLSWAFPKNNF